jgi:hypothetical protein
VGKRGRWGGSGERDDAAAPVVDDTEDDNDNDRMGNVGKVVKVSPVGVVGPLRGSWSASVAATDVATCVASAGPITLITPLCLACLDADMDQLVAGSHVCPDLDPTALTRPRLVELATHTTEFASPVSEQDSVLHDALLLDTHILLPRSGGYLRTLGPFL